MTITLDTPVEKHSREPLDKLFHVLLTPHMYTELEAHSIRYGLSKGALIRLGIREVFAKLNTPTMNQSSRLIENRETAAKGNVLMNLDAR